MIVDRKEKYKPLNKHIMIFKAYSQFTQTLLVLPETGMGYQIIDAKTSGKTNRFIVYNAELIIDFDLDFKENKQRILNESYERTLSESLPLELKNPILVSRSLVRNERQLSESTFLEKERKYTGTDAMSNALITVNTMGIARFVRLSAYSNDKRIDFERMRLKEGSFTTTESDYLACKEFNDDPVDRYALPNDETIKWAFFIEPRKTDQYRLGIVQPANKHDGGGAEAFFDHGTSDGTFGGRFPY